MSRGTDEKKEYRGKRDDATAKLNLFYVIRKSFIRNSLLKFGKRAIDLGFQLFSLT